jgi:hypothetical protein
LPGKLPAYSGIIKSVSTQLLFLPSLQIPDNHHYNGKQEHENTHPVHAIHEFQIDVGLFRISTKKGSNIEVVQNFF